VAAKAALAEYDDGVEAFAVNGADQAFYVGALPGCMGRGCPSPSAAIQTHVQKYGRDRAAENAARCPIERPRVFGVQAIPRLDVA
jgi:hypothetical protein